MRYFVRRVNGGRAGIGLACAVAGVLLFKISAFAIQEEVKHLLWVVSSGRTVLHLNPEAERLLHWRPGPSARVPSGKSYSGNTRTRASLRMGTGAELAVRFGPDGIELMGGTVRSLEPVSLSGVKGEWNPTAMSFGVDHRRPFGELMISGVNEIGGLILRGVSTDVDRLSGTVVISTDEVFLSDDLVKALDVPELADRSIGEVMIELQVERAAVNGEEPSGVDADLLGETGDVDVSGQSEGPDVIVSSLSGTRSYGTANDPITSEPTSGFSVGTTSCNIGSAQAIWIDHNNQHPVIAQNIYRLKDNRFEHIGMSWLKHGFYAVNSDCSGVTCIQPNGLEGEALGVDCSDPYSAALNGTQNNLGPRSSVNAFTGFFPYPFDRTVPQSNTLRRIQLRHADIDPALNPGTLYFAEGHYVTPDDAAAGNHFNNASYRRVSFVRPNLDPQQPICANLSPVTDWCAQISTQATRTMKAAIRAWKEADASVLETDAQVPNEGLFILAVKTTDLQNNFWRYEYALQNLNSHRSARSFRVPLPLGAVINNPGFHAPFYHSGEPYDGSPWTVTRTNNSLIWSTESFDDNQNANALRWGTLYNFRFDCNAEPRTTSVTIGLFRTGTPPQITAETVGPAAGFVDCNNNTVVDLCELPGNCNVPGCDLEPTCGESQDRNENEIPDECDPDCNNNQLVDECDLSCTIPSCGVGCGARPDCNDNHVPDECDPDCDHDGTPDSCEVTLDTDMDGVLDCAPDLCRETSPPGSCLCPPFDRCCFAGGGICYTNYPRDVCIAQSGTPDCATSPCRDGCRVGDFDRDGDIDLHDHSFLLDCFSGFKGEGYVRPSDECLLRFDFNEDEDVDKDDFGLLFCDVQGQCDDGNPCTTDRCGRGKCTNTSVPNCP